ncbi:alpha/beta hydrolase family protein [Rhizobium binxianense]
MLTIKSWMSGLAMLAGLAMGGVAHAQSHPEYIQFSPSATKGALYKPDSGKVSPVAFLAIHRTSNFLSLIATKELSRRGFIVLGMNPRSDNNEAAVDFEDIALDIRQGVEFLKKQPGIKAVILIGHSGGGPSTTYYQAVAEKGPSYCNTPEKLTKCTEDEVKDLPKADGLVLLDAHPGNTINALRSLNPAVTDESKPDDLDPALDPFNPENGFNPDGDSHYSAEFVERYSKAQSARMNRLIEKAQKMEADLKSGKDPRGDEPFIAYHNRARLSDISTGVWCCTQRPEKLLKNDGSISTEVIRSVRVSTPKNAKVDSSFDGGTLFLTVKSFLSANAIRSRDALNDIDICSSNNSTLCAVQSITSPLLVMSMGGHYFVRDGETIYDLAASKDKDFIVVEGAVHGMTPCKPCSEQTGVSYDNATKNLYDYVAAWANKRWPNS